MNNPTIKLFQDQECTSQLDTFNKVIGHTIEILSFVGVFLNMISIFVLSRPAMDNVFNRLLTALAVFDLGYIASYSIQHFWALDDIQDWKEHRNTYGIIQIVLHTIALFCYKASSFTTMAASLERYIAVHHPFRSMQSNLDISAKRRASCFYLVPVVLLSIGTIIPGLYKYEFNFVNTTIADEIIYHNETFGQNVNQTLIVKLNATQNIFYCLFIFILIHDIVLVAFNYKIYRKITKVRAEWKDSKIKSSKDADEKNKRTVKNDRKSAFILFMVVTVSIMAHIPCYGMAIAKWPLDDFENHLTSVKLCGQAPGMQLWYAYLFKICIMFAVINCSANFFIYNLAATKFRKIFLQYFCCKFSKKKLTIKLSVSSETNVTSVLPDFRISSVFSSTSTYSINQEDDKIRRKSDLAILTAFRPLSHQ